MIEVIHGDCLSILPTLAAGSVDAVVTDPPYGVNYNPCGGDGSVKRNNFPSIMGDDCPFDPSPLLKIAPIVILFGANHYADRLPSSSFWLVWDKREGGESNDMADCEFAWCNLRRPARLFHHKWMGMIRASERKEARVHATQKPVVLMEWAMDVVGISENSVVLDPYMGSGSVGVACKRTGRNFIGIDLDRKYVEIARQRIENEDEKRSLFVRNPERVKVSDFPLFVSLSD